MTAEHEEFRFSLRFHGEWYMDCHLVTVKISIKRFTDKWRNPDGLALYQDRQKRLNAEPVQSWRTVE